MPRQMPPTARARSASLLAAAALSLLAASTLTPALAQPLAPPPIPNVENPLVVLPNPYPSGVIVVREHNASTISQLTTSAAGWKIVEPSTNFLPSGDLTREQVAAMQDSAAGPCRSAVLAYLSIGEAENTRAYWNPAWVNAQGNPIAGVAPAWLGPKVTGEPGRYQVRYWNRAWKQTLFGTTTGPNRTPIDRIIDQGFDGVYLDAVDAFDHWAFSDPQTPRRLTRERMVALIEQIAAYAASRQVPQFRIVIQNGADIIWNDDDQPDDLRDRVAAVVRGVGHENLFYNGTKPQPEAHTQRMLDATGEMFQNILFPTFGLHPISYFSIDYVIAGTNINSSANRARAADYYQKSLNQGILPYAARIDRDLDEVVQLDGPKWTISQPNGDCNVCEVCTIDLTSPVAGIAYHSTPAPDGTVDLADYTYFLRAYSNNDPVADLTTTSTRALPGFARPDGRVNYDDLAFFLTLYSQANPGR